MNTRVLTRTTGLAVTIAAATLVTIGGATAAGPRTVHVTGALKVTVGPPPVCHAGICTIHNSGTGKLAPFGKVTFTTVINADGHHPPCGTRSQWVTRIVRTIHTTKGKLVLDEAGLQCPQPGAGPRVHAVWALDGAHSTGIFAGAHGQGTDIAYPMRDTAAPRGTIALGS
jgi:hypothetical protein